jgi:signal transduction histidine kinase
MRAHLKTGRFDARALAAYLIKVAALALVYHLAARRIAELKRATDEIQDNLHQLAVNLRPASLDHLGLVTALQQYAEEFGRKYHIKADFEAVGMEGSAYPLRSRLPCSVAFRSR